MFTLQDSPYKHDDIVRLGDGYEYLIKAKFDGITLLMLSWIKTLGILNLSSRSFPTNMGMRFQIQP